MRALCLFLLDRNVVDLIKESNAGKVQVDKKKIDFLSYLHSIDRASARISPMLSIIEGELGHEDSAEEKAACQKKESESLREFFKFAVLDSDFLDATSSMLGNVFTEHRESGWRRREKFSNIAAPMIAEQVKREKRKKLESELIGLARKHELDASEPIVVLMLACLYESWHARKLIKPREFNAYNVLSDLHILSRFNLIVTIAQKWNQSLRCKFVSRDEGLNGVLKYIRVISRNLDGEKFSLELQFLHGLFPALSIKEHEALLNRLVEENTIQQ